MNGFFLNVLWILFLIATFFYPAMKQKQVELARLKLLRKLEARRGSRVVTMIHRQESISFLGLPVARYISIEDSEQVLRAIRMTPKDMPIDIILHTPGGLVLATEQIALAIRRHGAPVTVFVPHYAMSGGTMLALAADEIIMDENAVLGPVDPQLGSYPAVSILEAVKAKPLSEVDDETLILADVARKAIAQVRDTVTSLLRDRFGEEQARRIADILTSGKWTHDYPLTPDQLAAIGLPVKVGLPREVYELMELYPQPPQRRPSVQFVPVPYRRERGGREPS